MNSSAEDSTSLLNIKRNHYKKFINKGPSSQRQIDMVTMIGYFEEI
jgi:hypothetical protein